MAAVGGSLTYTQRLMLDNRWNNLYQMPKRLHEADAERIRIEKLACQPKQSTTQR